MKVTYLERGIEFNFKRVGDRLVTVHLLKAWREGGLLYGYRDRFNVVAIPVEDIQEVEQ